MKKRMLSLLLILVMLMSLTPVFTAVAAAAPYDFWDLRNTNNITVSTLYGTLDGKALEVTHYKGYYAKNANSSKQQINIYVPSNATPQTAILHLVANGGWQANDFPTNTLLNGFNLSSAGDNPTVNALALKRGMVILSYGARSRNDTATADGYLGHSPATMTDTKAALRFLRYNYANGVLAGKGNPEQVFVTGTSGGGALSLILAASGNSPDYFESLYEIGAAGIEKVGGGYVSTISDAYYGTIAYCPITELPVADQAYEFTYNASRAMRASDTNVNGSMEPYESNLVMQASAWLANDFVSYVNGLGLRDEYGVLLTAGFAQPAIGKLAGETSGTFKNAMVRLLEKGIDKALREWASGKAAGFSNASSVDNLDAYSAWLRINGAKPASGIPAYGAVATIADFDRFLTDVPSSKLKIAPAFNNIGTQPAAAQNENDLYGSRSERFNQAHWWGWNHANAGNNYAATDNLAVPPPSVITVGEANTAVTWDRFLRTATGKLVALQMKMTTPIPYLLGAGKISYLKYANSSDIAVVAPYWYVRHGHQDRDTSFAVGTILYYALFGHSSVKDLNFSFAWQKPHGGTYDNIEAFAWLDKIKGGADRSVVNKEVRASVKKLSGNKNDLTITVTEYLYNGEVVVIPVTVSIKNNAAGSYQVGPYKVYVDTKGNDQIRACYFVN